jgi:hypothetical protein
MTNGAALVVEGPEQVEDLRAGAAVECAGRLVGEDEGRVVDESAGDRHALLLAAGKLARGMWRRRCDEASPPRARPRRGARALRPTPA